MYFVIFVFEIFLTFCTLKILLKCMCAGAFVDSAFCRFCMQSKKIFHFLWAESPTQQQLPVKILFIVSTHHIGVWIYVVNAHEEIEFGMKIKTCLLERSLQGRKVNRRHSTLRSVSKIYSVSLFQNAF